MRCAYTSDVHSVSAQSEQDFKGPLGVATNDGNRLIHRSCISVPSCARKAVGDVVLNAPKVAEYA